METGNGDGLGIGEVEPDKPELPKRRYAWLGIVASALIVLGSGFVLWQIAQEIELSEIQSAFASASRWQIAGAGALAAISYLMLTGYDALALRHVRLRVPYRITALASFTSYAVSFNLGFPLVTGGAVRYWIYGSRGVSAAQVASLTVIAGLTFWLGMGAILGWAMLTQAGQVAVLFKAPVAFIYLGSVGTLAIVASYFAFIARGKRVVRLQGWRLALPGWKLSTGQMLLGIGDLCAAAGVLFVLLPEGHGVSYGSFLALYIAAAMLGIAAHTPGGIGVFEATMLLGLSHLPTGWVLGSLLLFRLIYYFIPFVLALALLGAYEATGRIRVLRGIFRAGNNP